MGATTEEKVQLPQAIVAQPPYVQPTAAEKPPLQQQQQQQRAKPHQRRRLALVAAGVLFAALGVAAGITAILCSAKTLECSLQPFYVRAKGSSGSAPSSSSGGGGGGGSSGGSSSGSCPVSYARKSDAPPLLLGGASTSCTSGCQPRDSSWSESCKMDPASTTTWGLCEAGQRPALVALADSLSDGAASSFTPCDLHAALQGRTLWLIGDSHMKSTFTAIRCIMMDLWDHAQGECAAITKAEGQLELHKAELYAPRNLRLAEVTEPRCIHLIGAGGGRICFLHTVRGEVLASGDAKHPGVLELVQQRGHARPSDVFYVSFGRWYTHSCKHFEDRSYNKSLEALASHYEASKATFPNVFFGVPPFDHTTCGPGFDAKADGATCPPAGNSTDGTSIDMYYKIADYAHDILEPRGMHIIDYQEATLPLQGAHLAKSRSFKSAIDCLHYCRPGLPEMDVWFVFNAMKQRKVAAAPQHSEARQCTRVKPFL